MAKILYSVNNLSLLLMDHLSLSLIAQSPLDNPSLSLSIQRI